MGRDAGHLNLLPGARPPAECAVLPYRRSRRSRENHETEKSYSLR
jgi:hypothetical protein